MDTINRSEIKPNSTTWRCPECNELNVRPIPGYTAKCCGCAGEFNIIEDTIEIPAVLKESLIYTLGVLLKALRGPIKPTNAVPYAVWSQARDNKIKKAEELLNNLTGG